MFIQRSRNIGRSVLRGIILTAARWILEAVLGVFTSTMRWRRITAGQREVNPLRLRPRWLYRLHSDPDPFKSRLLPTGVAHATPFLWRVFWYGGERASERMFVTRFRVEPPLLVSRDFRAERPSHLLFVGGGGPKPIALAALVESVRRLMEGKNPHRLTDLSLTREMYETCVVRGRHTITGTFLLKRRGDSGWQVLALHRNPLLNRLVRIIREKIYDRQNKDFDYASSPWPDIRNCYPDWLKAFQANGVNALPPERVDSLLWSTDEFGVGIPTFLPLACTIVYRDLESLSHIEASLRHSAIPQVLKILETNPENFGTMNVPQRTGLLNPFDKIQFILPYLEAHWAYCQVIFRPTVSHNEHAADVFALINQAMREGITPGQANYDVWSTVCV